MKWKKYTRAVSKAFQSVGDHDPDKAAVITRQVTDILEITCRGLRVPDVEEVQDLVERC